MSALYRVTIKFADQFIPAKLQPFWNHPAGPKTVFFWAPVFKWVCSHFMLIVFVDLIVLPIPWQGLVIAGISDLSRPVETISIKQSSALALTGFIWSRYSLVIIPKNWGLFSVNLFVGFTGLYQLTRVFMHERHLKALEESAAISNK